ncbi:hypothetical protein D1869_07930 [Sulfurisphaera ohwakuensis]|uniref:Uncharacterized protein n=1 Tax=Sulfurisphaera ohwakuensis TaxID=69656 RepID=A0A650CGV7_SULOH|nr:hypothetical protein [Sulfurisphaera ohwakuensis]QGR17121.1 hypothetical protein D1869_07930 [Sulfurisphaera ohwakuensis]
MSTTEETLKPNIVLISASDLENEIKQLEDKIKQINNNNNIEFEKIKSELDKLHTITGWLNIAKSQGIWKSKTCRYVNNDSCSAWSISEPEKLGIPQDAIFVTENGSKKVVVAKFPELCITCPLYEPKKI